MSSSTSGGGGGGGGGYSKSTNTASPYQSQLYDSWKTEWGGTPAAYGYDQGQAGYRSGPGGSSGGEPDPYHSNKLERYRSVANLCSLCMHHFPYSNDLQVCFTNSGICSPHL